MITRKHLLFAIAVTCLLTVFLITIVPIRSQTVGQYDPWLDYNDDGKIDGRDIAPAARAFGTFGDPTKDVYVTNFPIVIQTMAAYGNATIYWDNPIPSVSGDYHNFATIKTTGFRKLYFSLTGNLTSGPYLCNLTIGWRVNDMFNSGSSWRQQIDHYEEIETRISYNTLGSCWREFDVKGQTIVIILGDTYANSYEMPYYRTS
jgi:hypothetical protein